MPPLKGIGPTDPRQKAKEAYDKVVAEMRARGEKITPPPLEPADTDWFTRTRNAPAYATTHGLPPHRIQYDPAQFIGKSPFEVEQVMQHELTHAKDFQDDPWYQFPLDVFNRATGRESRMSQPPPGTPERVSGPEYWGTREVPAFQSERDRATRLHQSYEDPVYGSRDIELPKDEDVVLPKLGPIKQISPDEFRARYPKAKMPNNFMSEMESKYMNPIRRR